MISSAIAPSKTLTVTDVIAAVATAPGPGVRAIIRVAGPGAAEVVARAMNPTPPLTPPCQRQWLDTAGHWQGLASTVPLGLLIWPEPRTPIGQELVEIHLPGSAPLVALALDLLLASGARLARSGEFTLRAFLAGKLDLTQAEAIHGIITATRPEELNDALAQLAGGLQRPLTRLRDDLLHLLAEIEAGLDFADEDIAFVSGPTVAAGLADAHGQVTRVLHDLDARAQPDRPYRIVLAGLPNAGKSSLFNALAQADLALVSAAAGTTRDYLTARLRQGHQVIELVDTAGVETASQVAADAFADVRLNAQRKQQEQTAGADLVLWCVPVGEPTPAAPPPSALIVRTKADLAGGPTTDAAVSVHDPASLDRLREHLFAHAHAASRPAPLAPSLTRCRAALERVAEQLTTARTTPIAYPELIALELRHALTTLGEIVGAIYTEDLLDRVFSQFCIGK